MPSAPNRPEKPAGKAEATASRKVAIVAVAVLVVVAIGGLVVAQRQRSTTEAPQANTSASAPAVASSSAAVASSPLDAASAVDVVFAPGADHLPPNADTTVSAWVNKARAEGKTLRLTARFAAGPNRDADRKRALARTEALRRVAQAAGLPGDKTQMELVEFAQGSVTPRDQDRVEFSLK